MGAVNYFTSDYITLGVKPYETWDFEEDKDFIDEMQAQIDQFGGSIEEAIHNYINDCYSNDLANIENELSKYSFYYFHIVIKPGYYEGFTLDIENNFPVAFDDFIERREAQKEITSIKKLLLDCAGLGLTQCFPGWCTSYSDYKTTIQAIKSAIKEMREEVKNTPTWRQYERGENN